MDAIHSWQAVLSELGGGFDNAGVLKNAVPHARTPPAAVPGPAHGGKEVFYTPLPAAQPGTPVDAWHSILTTLTGNAKAAHGRIAGARGSAGSSSNASLRTSDAAGQASPCGSPGMVRQLFSSTPRGNIAENAHSSTGSTPWHGLRQLQHQQQHLQQLAGSSAQVQTANKAAKCSPHSSPHRHSPASQSAHGYAGRSSCYQHSAGATAAAMGPQGMLARTASDAQQLADRLDNLRASAESILQTVTQAAGSPVGQPTAAQLQLGRMGASPVRASAGARASPHSIGGSSAVASAAAQQDGSTLPRQLFQSLVNVTAGRSSGGTAPTSPLRRLLRSAQQARDASVQSQPPVAPAQLSSARVSLGQAGVLLSPHGASGAYAGSAASAGHMQSSQGQVLQQQPLQQQFNGAVSKIDQLLAAMAGRQHGVGSSGGGSSTLQQPGSHRASTVGYQQGGHVLQQQQQQQEMMQQLLLQQQQLIDHLLPLIPRPDHQQQQAAVLGGSSAGGAWGSAGGAVTAPTATAAATGATDAHQQQLQQQEIMQLASLLQAAARVTELQQRQSNGSQGHGKDALLMPLLSEPPRVLASNCPQATTARVQADPSPADATAGIVPGDHINEQAGESAGSPEANTAAAVAGQMQAPLGALSDSAVFSNDTAAAAAAAAAVDSEDAGGRSAGSSRRSSSSGAAGKVPQQVPLDDNGGGAPTATASKRRKWHHPVANGVGQLTTPFIDPAGHADRQASGAPSNTLPRLNSSMQASHEMQQDEQDRRLTDSRGGNASVAEVTAGADSNRNREGRAAGSKSLPARAQAGSGSARHPPGRFLSQGPPASKDSRTAGLAQQQQDGSRSYRSGSSLAQQLGLPELVRFSGAHSTDGGAVSGQQEQQPASGRSSSDGSSGSGGATVPQPSQVEIPSAQHQRCNSTGTAVGSVASPAAGADGFYSCESTEQHSEPETPTAALPRVHTPGKPAAEVAAELSTPQLAHSAAAVMTVTEAWREETTGAQERWQQLLAEWSAAEVDTWESQRLTEPSAVTSQHSRMSSAPGLTPLLNLSQLTAAAAEGQDGQPVPLVQQQQQYDGKRSPAGQSTGGMHQSVDGGGEVAQQGGSGCTMHEQQQEQQQGRVTFARLVREHDLTPRMLPPEAPSRPAAVVETAPCVDAGGTSPKAAVEADASVVSLFSAAPQQQQQQQQEECQQEQQQEHAVQHAAAPVPPFPAWPDTTRKQLFNFGATGSSKGSSTRSSSSELGPFEHTAQNAAGGAPAAAAAQPSTVEATEGLGSGEPGVTGPPAEYVWNGYTQGAHTGREQVLQQQQQQSGAQQQQQQQPMDTQEEEGLERLNQLLHDLQGLQRRLQTIQLQTPRGQHSQQNAVPAQAPPAAAGAAAGSVAAVSNGVPSGVAAGAATSSTVSNRNSAVLKEGAAGPAAALPEVHMMHMVTSTAAAAADDTAEAVTLLQHAASAPAACAQPLSAAEVRTATAIGRITLLKQRLQDSRVALQAIATPVRGDQPADTAAAAAAAAAPVPGASGGSMLQFEPQVPAAVTPPPSAVRTKTVSTASSIEQQQQQLTPATAVRTTAGGRSAAAAAAAAAPPASAWLTGGSLQQYLERKSSTGRASSDDVSGGGRSGNPGAAAGNSGVIQGSNPGVASSEGGSNAGITHVQALVSNWRAAATAQQGMQTGALPATGLQPAEGATPYHTGSQVGPSHAANASSAGTDLRPVGSSQWLNATPALAHLQQLLAANRSAGGASKMAATSPAVAPTSVGAAVGAGGYVSPLAQQPRLTTSTTTPRHGVLVASGATGYSRGSKTPRSAGNHTHCSGAHVNLGTAAGAGAGSTVVGRSTPGVGGGSFTAAAGSAWTIHNPLFQQTPLMTLAGGSTGRKGGSYSSGIRAGIRSAGIGGLHIVETVGSIGGGTRTATRCSSTPPSTGNLMRWTQQGSPTRQLRQQLQATAQQFQQQQRERQQQQQQATLQVTPAAASIAKSFAALDSTLAGLRSVSPTRMGTGAVTPQATTAAPPAETYPKMPRAGLDVGGHHSSYASVLGSSGGRSVGSSSGLGAFAGRSVGRSAAEILAETAAAAEAARSGLGAFRTQAAAAARSVSPVQMLRRQQEMLVSIGLHG